MARPRFEIVPGVSIGPFRLGTMREDLREVARSFIAPQPSDPPGEVSPRSIALSSEPWDLLAISLHYDDRGSCKQIEAQIFDGRDRIPTFVLCGRGANNSDQEATLVPVLS